MASAPGHLAAIDCGTNSTRLLITNEVGTPVRRSAEVTRLGEKLGETGQLSGEAVGRTLGVLDRFRSNMESLGVRRARMVATAAVRDAENGSEFLRLASKVAGVEANLLTGEDEGQLAYLGATAGLGPMPRDGAVVMDIGGGSTELVVTAGGSPEVVSLPLGCVGITELYFGHDPPAEEEVESATAHIEGELRRALSAVPKLRASSPERLLIGLAGTVATLTALDRNLACYTSGVCHLATLDRQAVGGWCERLAKTPVRDRSEITAIGVERAEVILAGALILMLGMSALKAEVCMYSEHDILDGIVLAMMQQTSEMPLM